MIRGYPQQSSLVPGQILTLHVSTDRPLFRVDLYRYGAQLSLMSRSDWLTGKHVPMPATLEARTKDWDWPAYGFPIPADWPSGVYIAALVERDDQPGEDLSTTGVSRHAAYGRVLFVLKSTAPGTTATILYILPILTYHAYNFTGGVNYYMKGLPPTPDHQHRVTLRRPGGGLGGDLGGEYADHCGSACDRYDEASPRHSFFHWDAPFISWLLAQGYELDVCTDLDVHQDRDTLAKYRLMIFAGHHEYWTTEMRDHVEAYVRQGGNVAFLCGNTCWWRVRLLEEGTQVECHKMGEIDLWWSGAKRPENQVTGVSFRNGAGWWSGDEREAVGFTVQQTDSWVFEGTGLVNGDVIGKEYHLVGFECDGAALEGAPSAKQTVVPTYIDGTPKGFQILGWAQLTRFGNGVTGWFTAPRESDAAVVYAATMGLYSKNGTVFNGATTDWVRVVAKNKDAHVTRITRNVLDRLSSGARPHSPAGLNRRSLLKVAIEPLALGIVSTRWLRKRMTRRQLLALSVVAAGSAVVARSKHLSGLGRWLKNHSRP